MAWTSRDACDIPPDHINHICHPNRKVGLVTCLICDSVFCKSDFTRKVNEGKGFFISRHIIVCPVHLNLSFADIQPCDQDTDIEDSNVQKKLLIIQKHLENIKNGINMTQDSVSDNMDTDDKGEDDDAISIISIASEQNKKRKCEQNFECEDCQDYIRELSYEKKNE